MLKLSPNQSSPIPNVRNYSLQSPLYTWKCAGDQSVPATLGGGGAGPWAPASHCPLYRAQPQSTFQQDPGGAGLQVARAPAGPVRSKREDTAGRSNRHTAKYRGELSAFRS